MRKLTSAIRYPLLICDRCGCIRCDRGTWAWDYVRERLKVWPANAEGSLLCAEPDCAGMLRQGITFWRHPICENCGGLRIPRVITQARKTAAGRLSRLAMMRLMKGDA